MSSVTSGMERVFSENVVDSADAKPLAEAKIQSADPGTVVRVHTWPA